MEENKIIITLKDALEGGITDVSSFYELLNVMVNSNTYGEQTFVLKQIERYYHEAGVNWPDGFSLITSALVNCSNKNAKMLGRKLLNELYDQCRESHEALESLFFDLALDSKMKNNSDMQAFMRRVLNSVVLNDEDRLLYEKLLL